MVVWAGNTLKTCGEDFAECLHLMASALFIWEIQLVCWA